MMPWPKGKPVSEERKAKVSLASQAMWGKPGMKEKILAGHKRRRDEIRASKAKVVECACGCGKRFFNLDKQHRVKRYFSPAHIKRGKAPWNKGLVGFKAGEIHYNWKGGITPQTKLERQRFRKTMVNKVFKRDDYTCQICEVRGTELHVDHIKKWSEYPELRFEMSNLRTLCVPCHYYVTFKRKMPHGKVWSGAKNRRAEAF